MYDNNVNSVGFEHTYLRYLLSMLYMHIAIL